MAADNTHGGIDWDELAHRARCRRLQLSEHFVDPAIIEHAQPKGDVYLLTVRNLWGRLEQVTLEAAPLRAALDAAEEACTVLAGASSSWRNPAARIRPPSRRVFLGDRASESKGPCRA
jgi:hypothetical protein